MADDKTKCNLTIVILTLNEEIHIARCINNVRDIAKKIVIVDSYSTDKTIEIARKLGVEIYQNQWLGYSSQFNWALDNVPIYTKWVMKLDADEYLTDDLKNILMHELNVIPQDIAGLTINLRRIYNENWLKYGSLYPIRLLRIWRTGTGRLEDRWMDEHVSVNGRVQHLNADFCDHNLNTLSWWINKHNNYASREAAEVLNCEYEYLTRLKVQLPSGFHASTKRWVKNNIYLKLPSGLRAFFYFIYRYIFRLGFLDGYAGLEFHLLQGLWYRYLVDAKVSEVKRYMNKNSVSVKVAINKVLNI